MTQKPTNELLALGKELCEYIGRNIGGTILLVLLLILMVVSLSHQSHEPSQEELALVPPLMNASLGTGTDTEIEASDKVFGVYGGLINTAGVFLYHKVPQQISLHRTAPVGATHSIMVSKHPTTMTWRKQTAGFFDATVNLLIDNASDRTLKVEIGSTVFPEIPPKSHALATIEGWQLHSIRTSDSKGHVTSGQWYAMAYFQEEEVDYVYNYLGANSYRIASRLYQKEGFRRPK